MYLPISLKQYGLELRGPRSWRTRLRQLGPLCYLYLLFARGRGSTEVWSFLNKDKFSPPKATLESDSVRQLGRNRSTVVTTYWRWTSG